MRSSATAGGDWDGVAAYVNYQLSGQWRVSLRGEYFDDKDGFMTGVAQKLKEGTITFGYDPVSDFELRLEGRYDSSNEPGFVKRLSPATVSDRQSDRDRPAGRIQVLVLRALDPGMPAGPARHLRRGVTSAYRAWR